MVKERAHYKWSSCKAYYGETEYPIGLTDKELIFGMFSDDPIKAYTRFKEFNNQDSIEECLEVENKTHLTDIEAQAEIQKILNEFQISEIQGLAKEERNKIVKRVKDIEGISQRQASRILGIYQTMISKV